MQSKNTKQRPRRSRMPQMVYDTARGSYSNLKYWEAWLDHPETPPDEKLCCELKAPLKKLADLAGIELSKELHQHPHRNPDEVETLIREAMRLYYGLSDKREAGEKLSEEDEARLWPMMETFTEITNRVGEAHVRSLGRYKAEQQAEEEASRPNRATQIDDERLIEGMFDIDQDGIIARLEYECEPRCESCPHLEVSSYDGKNLFTEIVTSRLLKEFGKNYAKWRAGSSPKTFKFPHADVTFLRTPDGAIVLCKRDDAKPKSKPRRLYTAKRVEKELIKAEPMLSIHDGVVRVRMTTKN